jgi:S1-C subfamily serine protease
VVTISASTSQGSGTGSGVVVRLAGVSDTAIITNDHVVHPGQRLAHAADHLRRRQQRPGPAHGC